MDQDQTNGATSDKRNWRERLGIGTRDMPKLSDEFKSQPPAQPAAKTAAPVTQRPAAKPPQAVTRPAPMAPRGVTARPAPAPVNGQQRVNGGQTQVPPSPSQEALAEKLRAQRAAAEKLAEQRVQAARERAEAKPAPSAAAEPTPSFTRSRPPEPRPIERSAEPPLGTVPPQRPKFSFADDEAGRREAAAEPPPSLTQRPSGSSSPLLPPRPALGGERSQPPFLRPAAPLGQQTMRPEPPMGYRPIDPASNYSQPPARPPAGTMRPYSGEPSVYPGRLPPRPPSYDPYSRAPEAAPYAQDPYGDDQRIDPRLSRPPAPRSRPRSYEPEQEEVFEDEAPPRRRASARDYQSAYREAPEDEGYEDDSRRSSGPWLLIGSLLAVAILVAGGIWVYNTKYKPGIIATQSTTDSVPVVAAPELPAKTAPEQPVDAQSGAPAVKKKQIYDRIVGDQEVTGDQVVPTEEVPVQPEPAASAAPDQGANVPAATGLPQPAAGAADTAAQPLPDDSAPLPLPPPPGSDTQGSLDQNGIEKMATAASSDPPALPPPEPATASAANTEQASPPSPDAPAVTETPVVTETPELIPASKPAKTKAATVKSATKKKVAATTAPSKSTGTEPLVLVPPSQDGSPTQGADTAIPADAIAQPAPAPEIVKKKKTIFDLFKGTSAEPAQPAQQQVASAEPQPLPETPPAEPAPQVKQAAKPAAAPSGSGYYIQLASFRTQGEAQSEYARLKSEHAGIIGGVASSISEATVAGSTRYRVGLGPMASREQAAKLCNSLFAAGERDCLVRTQ